MRHLLLPTLLLFTALFFARCSKCNCIDSDISFGFAGFTTTELKQIELKKWGRGSGFSQVVNSAFFQDEIDYRLQQQGDAVHFAVRTGDIAISKEWDWQITLPAAGRTFRITDIDMAQIRGDCSGKVQCGNSVRSMRIDGALLQGPISSLNGFLLRK